MPEAAAPGAARAPDIPLIMAAMACFAGNSLLCRLALQTTAIDAGSFTAIRMIAGAATLWAIVGLRGGDIRTGGNWASAAALAVYMVGFSFAYTRLPTAVGALLLFGAVQATMIGAALHAGERLRGLQLAGFGMAAVGLVLLLLPGLAAPSLPHALMMLAAGVAWGVYSLRGRGPGDPTLATAGNFLRAVPFAIAIALLTAAARTTDTAGIIYAVASGALASGVGYALWYAALRRLNGTSASIIQLSVPVLAAFGGVVLLQEALTPLLLLASVAILGGIALVIGGATPARFPPWRRRRGS